MQHTILVLEDGRVFEGEGFGALATQVGEICFNTSMTGYQEVLTDPSYYGQIVAMTYPLIGNYGINSLDNESSRPHVRGFVIEELSEIASNWRSELSLDQYLAQYHICGIQGIDTRALTRHLRERGAMTACITSDPNISLEKAQALAKESSGVVGMDFVKEVTAQKPYEWDPASNLSQSWDVPQLPKTDCHIVVYDFGLKINQLRCLRQQGFKVTVVPATTSAEDVLNLQPDGIFLSNGPGDPAALHYAHQNVQKLLGKKPIFGICLGHQILAYAFGGKTFKLKFGHRGGNQPVKDLRTGRVDITSQNHGFAVDADSLPSAINVTHINLNDHTVEGLQHTELPVFSVQYHPEAAPGPSDASHFFSEFHRLVLEHKPQ